jgi:diaminohydroxyphosphoribosylaminopyrimidine deaminase/5-amino-6-(5-phosphoribosylamino)uracil reductase
MRRALQFARRGWGRTAPNPMVGAVVVHDGVVVGAGWHAAYGGPHAEVVALAAAGERARGADVFVTLEPCAHHGQTPPCTDALITAGVRRVVIAVGDPNPLAGGGVARLREAGIAVTTGVELAAASELNAPFLFAHRVADRPFITLKLALSLDGALATGDGTPRWLTGDAAPKYVHRLRAGADAIGVGIGTALADDPALTVRHGRRPRVAPVRVVFDPRGRLPLTSKLVRTANRVPTCVVGDAVEASTAAALAKQGVRVMAASGLLAQLAALRAAGLRHLFVEGGAGIAGALLSADLVDRLIIFQAPVLLGAGALPAFGGVSLGARTPDRWRVIERRVFGDDLMTMFAPPER